MHELINMIENNEPIWWTDNDGEEHEVEVDGFDDKGKPKYRIQENITNIQVATLVACYFAEKFQLNNNVVDYANDCDNAELFAIHTI